VRGVSEGAAVGPAQRRTRDDNIPTIPSLSANGVAKPTEPWPTILIAQGMPLSHLFDVGGRVKGIAFDERRTEQGCKLAPDRRLAAATYPDEDEDKSVTIDATAPR
jgi:hypothetical protein